MENARLQIIKQIVQQITIATTPIQDFAHLANVLKTLTVNSLKSATPSYNVKPKLVVPRLTVVGQTLKALTQLHVQELNFVWMAYAQLAPLLQDRLTRLVKITVAQLYFAILILDNAPKHNAVTLQNVGFTFQLVIRMVSVKLRQDAQRMLPYAEAQVALKEYAKTTPAFNALVAPTLLLK